MRINKFIASSSSLSRRGADAAISEGRVTLNGQPATLQAQVTSSDTVTLDGMPLAAPSEHSTVALNKPRGYVVSRNGQGSQTIYDLLPPDLQTLNPIGRLDKDSSGLLLLTSDGTLANELTHPSRQKQKVYQVRLDTDLQPLHRQMISDYGVTLDDGLSKLELERQHDGDDTAWIVRMHEGRNRQIRRTFAAVGYTVVALHRVQFGEYVLGDLASGSFETL